MVDSDLLGEQGHFRLLPVAAIAIAAWLPVLAVLGWLLR